MRVGFVIPYLRSQGGWSTASQGAVRSLARYVDPVLFVSHEDEPTARRLFPQLPVIVLPYTQLDVEAGGISSLLVKMMLTRVAVERLPTLSLDGVHSLEMFTSGWVGHWLAAKEGTGHVLTAHGTYAVIWKRWAVLRSAYKGVLRKAAAICPVSEGTAARLLKHFGQEILSPAQEAASRMTVVLQGTDATARVPREVAESHRFPETPIILTIGAIKPRKGYHVSLRSFAALHKRWPDARYLVGGRLPNSKYHSDLQRVIQADRIRGVEFLGEVSGAELETCYRKSSLLLLLSQEEEFNFEGFGLVFLEAGAHGLPVVGSRTGGIPDSVQDGRTGILVDPTDVQGAASAMERLIADPTLARRMGLAGRRFAESLTWERYAEQMVSVYRRALT